MALNSVNTNMGAMVALQSLNRTGSEMATTQKAISTGYRVSDAKDDGAAYAIAQRVRSDVSGLTTVNQQLSGTKGLLDTTLKGLDNVTKTMKDMREILTNLASANVTGSDRDSYVEQYKQKLQSMKDFVSDANYNNKSLIGNFQDNAGAALTGAALTTAKTAADFGDTSVVRNEKGSATTITATDLTADLVKLNFADADLKDTAKMAAVLGGTSAGAAYDGVFKDVQTAVSKTANTYGTTSKYIDDQITYNSDKIDALKGGLGALIDADLSKEAANLQALQVRQQLGTQSLSMANQAPQSLLSLFR